MIEGTRTENVEEVAQHKPEIHEAQAELNKFTFLASAEE